jgi:hypothetical protein
MLVWGGSEKEGGGGILKELEFARYTKINLYVSTVHNTFILNERCDTEPRSIEPEQRGTNLIHQLSALP